MSHLIQETSREAFASIQPILPALDAEIFSFVQAHGSRGIASHTIVSRSGRGIQSVSGALRRLTVRNLIRDSGRRDTAPSGRRAILWIPKEAEAA